jgi:hypothetical protein
VWSNWASAERRGGFDAVIGNPPWDRLKLEQVKWFEAHKREIAMAQRAADRQRMIAAIVRRETRLRRTLPRPMRAPKRLSALHVPPATTRFSPAATSTFIRSLSRGR